MTEEVSEDNGRPGEAGASSGQWGQSAASTCLPSGEVCLLLPHGWMGLVFPMFA